jgi:hypothetical protein
VLTAIIAILLLAIPADALDLVDITDSAIMVTHDDSWGSAAFVGNVLAEEIARRSGVRWSIVNEQDRSPIIELSIADSMDTDLGDEGYRIAVDALETFVGGMATVRIGAMSKRGLLYGVGRLLREVDWTAGVVLVSRDLMDESRPYQMYRGHLLGYGPELSMYSAWSTQRYEQYVRELIMFGANAIGNAPTEFKDTESYDSHGNPNAESGSTLSAICADYGVDYWIVLPASSVCGENASDLIASIGSIAAMSAKLDGILLSVADHSDDDRFECLMSTGESVRRLFDGAPSVPDIWLGVWDMTSPELDSLSAMLETEDPAWLTGVAGSPAMRSIRNHIPRRFDVTVCADLGDEYGGELPTRWRDPALTQTLLAVAPNPRPEDAADLHAFVRRGSAGILLRSQGVNDEVNRAVWTALSWDPEAKLRDIIEDYASCHLGPDISAAVVDAVLALERNWRGPLTTNGGVEATLRLWRELDADHPELQGSWRWQLLLLRAYSDAYTRDRLIYEEKLEARSYAALTDVLEIGANASAARAERELLRAIEEPVRPELSQRIHELTYELIRSIGYGAVSLDDAPESVLDPLNVPLNNRLWLVPKLESLRDLASDSVAQAEIQQMIHWEVPVRGSYYDDIGNISNSPDVLRNTGSLFDRWNRNESGFGIFDAADDALRDGRRSWQSYAYTPVRLRYDALDPDVRYVLRASGHGELALHVDGQTVESTGYEQASPDMWEWALPAEIAANGTICIELDDATSEVEVGEESPQVYEVWLIPVPISHSITPEQD